MNQSDLGADGAVGEVVRVATPGEAAEVSAFLLGPGLFGTPLTPGEQDDFQARPVAALGRPDDAFWLVRNVRGDVCAAIGVHLHPNRTGIFEISALAIQPACRHRGLGRRLLDVALSFIAAGGGRGLIFDTSAAASYAPMRRLLEKTGFVQVGCFPDFYYPGEDTVWYYRAINR